MKKYQKILITVSFFILTYLGITFLLPLNLAEIPYSTIVLDKEENEI